MSEPVSNHDEEQLVPEITIIDDLEVLKYFKQLPSVSQGQSVAEEEKLETVSQPSQFISNSECSELDVEYCDFQKDSHAIYDTIQAKDDWLKRERQLIDVVNLSLNTIKEIKEVSMNSEYLKKAHQAVQLTEKLGQVLNEMSETASDGMSNTVTSGHVPFDLPTDLAPFFRLLPSNENSEIESQQNFQVMYNIENVFSPEICGDGACVGQNKKIEKLLNQTETIKKPEIKIKTVTPPHYNPPPLSPDQEYPSKTSSTTKMNQHTSETNLYRSMMTKLVRALPSELPKDTQEKILENLIHRMSQWTKQITNLQSEKLQKYGDGAIDFATLQIAQRPLLCPSSGCNKYLFYCDVAQHFKISHKNTVIRNLEPEQETKFYWDLKTDRIGSTKCQAMFLVKNKIRFLGEGCFSNDLPVLLMTSKLKLSDLIEKEPFDDEDNVSQYDPCIVLVWLAGLCTEELITTYELVLSGRPSAKEPVYRAQISGLLPSLRNEQDPISVYRSGNALMLNQKQYHEWSRCKQELLKIQLKIH